MLVRLSRGTGGVGKREVRWCGTLGRLLVGDVGEVLGHWDREASRRPNAVCAVRR